MIDLEEWTTFLTRYGVGIKQENGDVPGDPVMRLCLKKGAPKVTGYNDFYIDVEFDENGRFVQIGAWE
jgi:hypothetical protein